jgi:selenide,water dikinase
VISTALKQGFAEQNHIDESIAQMLTLNRSISEALHRFEVHACTDVTGFGLLGHAREMALASHVTLELSAGAVRFLPGAVEYSRRGAHSGGLNNNRDFVESCVLMPDGIASEIEALLYDPQTSGGLLVSLPERDAQALLAEWPEAYVIGRVKAYETKPLAVIA